MASAPIDLLRKACTGNLSSNTSLSSDGKTLTILGSSHDATTLHNLTLKDAKVGGGTTKEVSYTLASMYLQLLHPSVLQYRKACEGAEVGDPVKILDKAIISDYFFHAAGEEGEGEDDAAAAEEEEEEETSDKKTEDAMDMSDDDDAASASNMESVQFSSHAPVDEKRSSRSSRDKDPRSSRRERGGDHSSSRDRRGDKDRSSRDSGSKHHRHHKDKDRDHRSHSKSRNKDHGDDNDDRGRKSSSSKVGKGANKAAMVPITNEQLVANLSTIVDKRDTTASMTATPLKEGTEDDDGADDGAADEATDATPGTAADLTQITPLAATPVPTDDEEDLLSKEEAEKKEKEDRELLLSWLSPVGFQVNSPTVAAAIQADREAVRRITALEIPVGDSASILRAGAGGEIVEKSNTDAAVGGGGPSSSSATAGGGGGSAVKKRDFARVLEIYQEVVTAEEKAKRSSSSSGSGKKRPPPPPSSGGSHRSKSPRTSSNSGSASSGGTSAKSIEGNPIIVVPNAMTSVITMTNAGFFLGKDAVYIQRDQAMRNPAAGKRGGTISITRKLAARLGGSEITYDIIDNPTTRLKKDEWNRVVAVVCQGASWQFKGWRYSDPVDLFSRSFGFFVGLEGATVPNELKGWNVKIGRVSRDRRGSDSICLASFWNGLEEFMAVHKQELIQS